MSLEKSNVCLAVEESHYISNSAKRKNFHQSIPKHEIGQGKRYESKLPKIMDYGKAFQDYEHIEKESHVLVRMYDTFTQPIEITDDIKRYETEFSNDLDAQTIYPTFEYIKNIHGELDIGGMLTLNYEHMQQKSRKEVTYNTKKNSFLYPMDTETHFPVLYPIYQLKFGEIKPRINKNKVYFEKNTEKLDLDRLSEKINNLQRNKITAEVSEPLYTINIETKKGPIQGHMKNISKSQKVNELQAMTYEIDAEKMSSTDDDHAKDPAIKEIFSHGLCGNRLFPSYYHIEQLSPKGNAAECNKFEFSKDTQIYLPAPTHAPIKHLGSNKVAPEIDETNHSHKIDTKIPIPSYEIIKYIPNNEVNDGSKFCELNSDVPAPEYEHVINKQTREIADIIDKLPTYSSLSIDILNDEPPRYEAVMRKRLDKKLNTNNETTWSHSLLEYFNLREHHICKLASIMIGFLFITVVCIVVVFLTYGKKHKRNMGMEQDSFFSPRETNHYHSLK